ncbi:Protein AroA(G) [Paenibacillus plantiphilus]|uniref:Protein AroA(G) n=1 Tax=Paenibacillus plantiphilus TaxID=2905650 RepID=A0ABM9CW00_9BACL|nr:chorismate mutase [Paenibacillus plantiphilus]CAH1225508.1 Protein AroA(G) [Paenibacillus plantiphilus]
MSDRIDQLRVQIDAINSELLTILNKRAEVVLEIGKAKQEKGMEVFDPEREERILSSLCSMNRGLLTDEMIRVIFKQIFDECSNLQRAQMNEAMDSAEMTKSR